MSEEVRHSSDHYNTLLYPKTVAMERGYANGLTPEELYQREGELALRAAGALDGQLQFEEGEGILDVAVGTGEHAMVMSNLLNDKVPITAMDRADVLIRQAEAKVDALGGAIREKVKFRVGDMADIGQKEKETYKLITVLGQSFIFQNDHDRRQTLKAMYDLLPKGGKLVLGWRSWKVDENKINKEELAKAREDLGMEEEECERDGAVRTLTKNTKTGESFYQYMADAKHPDPSAPEGFYTEGNNGERYYKDKNGIYYFAFGRMFFDEKGNKYDMGVTDANNFLNVGNMDVIEAQLKEAGFADVKPVEDEELMGMQANVAVVATK